MFLNGIVIVYRANITTPSPNCPLPTLPTHTQYLTFPWSSPVHTQPQTNKGSFCTCIVEVVYRICVYLIPFVPPLWNEVSLLRLCTILVYSSVRLQWSQKCLATFRNRKTYFKWFHTNSCKWNLAGPVCYWTLQHNVMALSKLALSQIQLAVI